MQAANQDPSLLDQMSKNVTRQGITPATLNYLRVCLFFNNSFTSILEVK